MKPRNPYSRLSSGADSAILSTVRPAPYHGAYACPGESELARQLRADFAALLRRRLPWHHLCGLRHGAAPRFVERYRRKYPFYLRTDISRFYPMVRHQDLAVGVQLAYRDLLGLGYVPAKFKSRYLGAIVRWCEGLPLRRGIPLGSPLSAVAAPLMLVPLWLEVRRTFGVPVMVVMDDVLICCRSAQECAEVYALVENRLADDYELTLHAGKTESGRFASGRFSFCGWSFSGGYARIDAEKQEAFRQRISHRTRLRSGTAIGLIKRVNRLTDGFGNYYKHGDVKRQYETLDIHIRRCVRQALSQGTSRRIYNAELESLGLHSLTGILRRAADRQNAPHRHMRRLRGSPRTASHATPVSVQTAGYDRSTEETAALLRRIDTKLTQMLKGQRELCRILERLSGL